MKDVLDCVIVGGGPAGFAAGLYAARARLSVVLVERLGYGGQLLTYERIENYPGFPEGVTAFGLVDLFTAHALRFGLSTRMGEVTALEIDSPVKRVVLADGEILARSVILATGASPNKLGAPGEIELTGRGVSYCAVCDGPFYRGLEVAVIGGGDTAVEEAIYLTRFASRVHLIHRRGELRATRIIQEHALKTEKLTIHWHTTVSSILGGQAGVERLMLADARTGEPRELPVSGVFVFVGIRPNAAVVPASVARDAGGFVVTDPDMTTSVPGVFAAGDVRSKTLRQVVTAVGDGAVAAYNAGRFIEAHQGS